MRNVFVFSFEDGKGSLWRGCSVVCDGLTMAEYRFRMAEECFILVSWNGMWR